ncbi:LAGLIDADG family homing endonuclease [Streptomyces sp. NPDC102467]|uniref:LAGLIDADG family homing endonuclease n=1 Tax=Streptomyces sp. NPDC102467 TaxID=3366179 RepID=UPI0038280066
MDLEVPEYAYMFGFLQMDGHLAQGAGQKGRLSAEINIRDVEILRRFQELTPYNSSITERVRSTNFAKSHHSATWALCALEARTKLTKLGLPYGRKSKKIAPPRGVPFSRRDYLRGVIDADGSVGYTTQGLPFISLTTASTAIAAYFCFYAKKITGATRHPNRNQRDGIYNVLYCKEASQELAAHFYYPGCLALDRKQASAESLSNWIRPTDMKVSPNRRRWKEWEDRVLLRHGNAADAAGELGRSLQSCSLRLWRLRTGQVPTPL